LFSFLVQIKEDLTYIDVLVCGLCHLGFHFVEEFQQHKTGDACTKVSALREQNTTVLKNSILFHKNVIICNYV